MQPHTQSSHLASISQHLYCLFVRRSFKALPVHSHHTIACPTQNQHTGLRHFNFVIGNVIKNIHCQNTKNIMLLFNLCNTLYDIILSELLVLGLWEVNVALLFFFYYYYITLHYIHLFQTACPIVG